jgi:hypothetical protein
MKEEIKIQGYEPPLYLMRCSECSKPLCYFNGWHDGGKLCFDCAARLEGA